MSGHKNQDPLNFISANLIHIRLNYDGRVFERDVNFVQGEERFGETYWKNLFATGNTNPMYAQQVRTLQKISVALINAMSLFIHTECG